MYILISFLNFSDTEFEPNYEMDFEKADETDRIVEQFKRKICWMSNNGPKQRIPLKTLDIKAILAKKPLLKLQE